MITVIKAENLSVENEKNNLLDGYLIFTVGEHEIVIIIIIICGKPNNYLLILLQFKD
jgi:hypothetical protein